MRSSWPDLPPLGPNVPQRGNAFTRWLGRSILRLGGFRLVGEFPNLPRMVILGVPHTSNWDFIWGMGTMLAMGLKGSFFGKDSLFWPPFSWLMRFLGGEPVDRSSKNQVVDQIVQRILASPKFILALSPEGTRHRISTWRSGFYHIALGAKIPILLGFFDYEHKEVGFGPLFWPSGDYEADLKKIREFYQGFRPCRPENYDPGL